MQGSGEHNQGTGTPTKLLAGGGKIMKHSSPHENTLGKLNLAWTSFPEKDFKWTPETVQKVHDIDVKAEEFLRDTANRCRLRRYSGENCANFYDAIRKKSPEIAQEARIILTERPQLRALLSEQLERMRDFSPETHSHSLRVASLAAITSKALVNTSQATNHEAAAFCVAAVLHDFGKLCVPDEILHYPGKLVEPEEILPMRRHVEYSKAIVDAALGTGKNGICDTDRLISRIVSGHHESHSGEYGYPYNRKLCRDSELVQLLPIIDRFDAMTADRTYRKGMAHDDAMNILRDEAGIGELSKGLLRQVTPHIKQWHVAQEQDRKHVADNLEESSGRWAQTVGRRGRARQSSHSSSSPFLSL